MDVALGEGLAEEAPSRLIRMDPIPAAVVLHAYPQIVSAATPPPREPKEGEEPERMLQAVLLAEPLRYKTRIWAAYNGEDAADAGRTAIEALPQFDELLDLPDSKAETLWMAKQTPPPPKLSEEELRAHCACCDQLARALDERVDLVGSLDATLAPLSDADVTLDDEVGAAAAHQFS